MIKNHAFESAFNYKDKCDQKFKKSDQQLQQEWDMLEEEQKFTSLHQPAISICDNDKDRQHLGYKSKTHGRRPKNIDKNRYSNIIPYTHSRVLAKYGYYDEEEKSQEQSSNGSGPGDLHNNKQNLDRAYYNGNSIGSWSTQKRGRHYIAVQGPIGEHDKGINTIADFWRAMASNPVKIIVALCKKVENGKSKCGQYWPDFKHTKYIDEVNSVGQELNIMDVYCEEEIFVDKNGDTIPDRKLKNEAIYVKRKLKVLPKRAKLVSNLLLKTELTDMKAGQYQTEAIYWYVYQFQFLKWPDHGVPVRMEELQNFMEDVDLFYKHLDKYELANHAVDREIRYSKSNLDYLHLFNNSKFKKLKNLKSENYENILKTKFQGSSTKAGNLVCVHCSAGVGRTGTIILLDQIIDMLKWNGLDSEIDIVEMLRNIRARRSNTVQTFVQYKFVHEFMKYYIESEIERQRKGQKEIKNGAVQVEVSDDYD